jgi:hypothetical protein
MKSLLILYKEEIKVVNEASCLYDLVILNKSFRFFSPNSLTQELATT